MAIIESPKSSLVAKLRGLHLFGFDAAPCCQRVCFALAEKGLMRGKTPEWRSGHADSLESADGKYVFRQVSLIKKQHLSQAYAEIQPNMVVPAFVHDGILHIESMDIVKYIDETWPGSRLTPVDPERAALAAELVELGKSLHVSVRYVSFHWGLGRFGKVSTEDEALIERLEEGGSPEKLLEFYSKYNRDAIDENVFLDHLGKLEDGWSAQEDRLSSDGRKYLVGDTFSVADIIWSIKVLRILECGYPFADRFPNLFDWFERVRRRPAFQDGVMYHHGRMNLAFRIKAAFENFFGFGIRSAARR